ncbi:transposable element tcb2 transposase [Trichonephila clavipes]|nr:transposable element tcb2 transposase [Trichonephila clavipes]
MGYNISEVTMKSGFSRRAISSVYREYWESGDRYLSILHPFMSIVHPGGHGEFKQDNATPHTSRIATDWLQEHFAEFRHFRWPPKSPDVSIIEHISDVLQRAVQKGSPSPLTPTDLWTALQD